MKTEAEILEYIPDLAGLIHAQIDDPETVMFHRQFDFDDVSFLVSGQFDVKVNFTYETAYVDINGLEVELYEETGQPQLFSLKQNEKLIKEIEKFY